MVIAFVAAIFIFLYVVNEFSYDRHFSNHKRLYRVALEILSDERELRSAITVAPLGRQLKEAIPEVVEFATFSSHSRVGLIVDNETFIEPSTIVVTRNFLDVLDFKLKTGNPENALSKPYSILISESRAIKYFGSTNVIGQVIRQAQWGDFKITGILEDPPKETHFQPQAVIYLNDDHFPLDEWKALQFYNYILLQDRAQREIVEEKLSNFYQAYLKESFGERGSLFLQNVTDIHLHSDLDREHLPNGSLKKVVQLASLGFFIVLVACINYMNLSTTEAVKRMKEIGIRSVMGSTKSMLRCQWLIESSLIILLSLVISIALVILLIPFFNEISNKTLTLAYLLNRQVFLGLFILFFAVAIIGGAYPGIFLARLKPVFLFRKTFKLGSRHIPLGKFLNAIQFFIAILAVSLTAIVYSQMSFIREFELGAELDQIVKVDLKQRIRPQKQQTYKNELLVNPNIQQVSFLGQSLGTGLFGAGGLAFETADGNFMQIEEAEFNTADQGMIPTLGIEMLAGNNFSEGEADSLSSGQAIINETLLKSLGYTLPEEVIGKHIKVPNSQDVTLIIGVVKDFHHLSLHHKIKPLAIVNFLPLNTTLLVKMNNERLAEGIPFIHKTIEDLTGSSSHEITFLDEAFHQQYHSDEIQGKILTSFSILTLSISLIGLIGLISFSFELKKKAMTIRKVFGAGLNQIFYLFARESLATVGCSLLVAIPVAIFMGKKWLSNFAYRIDPGIGLFFGTTLLIILLVGLIMMYYSQKTYAINPVDNLNDE